MNKKINILIIIASAIIIRIYFSVGFVFSDDTYYSYLANSILNGNYAVNFLGYPIFLLRTNFSALLAFAFKLFGVNEFALAFFPLFFSISNLFLVYLFAKVVTKNETISLLSLLLMSFFPTDVIFATIAFPDLIDTFFIYLGIFLLWKAFEQKKFLLSILSGICFFISMQFKEDVYFFLIILFLFWIYLVYKRNSDRYFILIPILIIASNFLVEGLLYWSFKNDLFYRFRIIQSNYKFSFYDFFPYTVRSIWGNSSGYWKELFYQIFFINLKSIFIRRFYLFLPLIALIASIINIRERKYLKISFLFILLSILFVGFTASFSSYSPLDLHRSWYIYPMLIPVIILSSILMMKFNLRQRFILISLYIFFSIAMCHSYEFYFDKINLTDFKRFIMNHQNEIIYTDHYTGYGIEFLEGYKNQKNVKIFEGDNFNEKKISKRALVILNKKHIEELKLQKYKFPNLAFVKGKDFKHISTFGDYVVFEKII